MLKNLREKIIEFRSRDRLKFRLNPGRDWKIVLLFFFFLVTIAFLSDYLFLETMNSDLSAITPSNNLAGLSIDRNSLSNTLNLWRLKDNSFNNLLETPPPPIIDPAL